MNRWSLAVLCVARVAVADDKPWAAGVSEAEQQTALALYKEGNAFFEDSEYKKALAKYEEALPHWDHPAIRYNAAVCLFNLDRAVDAFEYLESALRFGEAPLGHALFVQAQNYQKLLAKSVGELEVTCKQAGAQVTLDGKPLPACPSTTMRHVLVTDPHEVVGKLDGYKTESIPAKAEPGKKVTVDVELHVVENGTLVRRWDRRLPWAVVAGGGAVALAGVLPLVWGRHNQSNYDADINRYCPAGCASNDPTAIHFQPVKDRADLDAKIAGGMFVVGGLAVAAGISMVLLNQPHLEKPVVAPAVGPDHAGVIVTGRW